MRRPRAHELAFVAAGSGGFGMAWAVGRVWVGAYPWEFGVLQMLYAGLYGVGWAWIGGLLQELDKARETRDDLRARLTDQLMADLDDGATKIVFCGDCPARGTAADFGRSLGEEQQ